MKSSYAAALALTALGMAGCAEPVLIVDERPQSQRRRATPEPTNDAPHEAKFIGDGFDRDRIEAAERKRARKAAKLAGKPTEG